MAFAFMQSLVVDQDDGEDDAESDIDIGSVVSDGPADLDLDLFRNTE